MTTGIRGNGTRLPGLPPGERRDILPAVFPWGRGESVRVGKEVVRA